MVITKIYRRIPKTRHCVCIHDNVYLDYSLFPFTWWSFFGQFWLTRALDCKYDNLYSPVGSKPLLGCFTRMFIVSAICNAGLPIKYNFNCFLKAGRVLVSEIVARRLFQVHGPATS